MNGALAVVPADAPDDAPSAAAMLMHALSSALLVDHSAALLRLTYAGGTNEQVFGWLSMGRMDEWPADANLAPSGRFMPGCERPSAPTTRRR